jgi:glyoxylase-like metal-dependent hydrolase (beta-lactamase superfamily II)
MMVILKKNSPESKHFKHTRLADGVYACIHKPGGGAFSNAGIIDLGERTLVVDAFDTQAAGRDLRRMAEFLFDRPVDMIVLTHPHSDHWVGASVFDTTTVLLASKRTKQVSQEWGELILQDFQNPSEWEAWIDEMEQQLQTEKDERVRAGLENSLIHTRYVLAEIDDFQPRYANQIFESNVKFHGTQREAELRSFGKGHSEDDSVLLLHQDGIAFMGDIGFFDSQPFLGFCDIDLYRQQLTFFQNIDFSVLVPGHGPVGSQKDVALQLQYMDVLEERLNDVVQRNGSFQDAMQIRLPEPFDSWLTGGMGRFESNVRYLFAHLGGEVPPEE